MSFLRHPTPTRLGRLSAVLACAVGIAGAAEGDGALDPSSAEDPFADHGHHIGHGDGDQELKWGGYGELHYNLPMGEDDVLDFHRFVLFGEYQFDETFKFVTEREGEHAFVEGGGESGEVEL